MAAMQADLVNANWYMAQYLRMHIRPTNTAKGLRHSAASSARNATIGGRWASSAFGSAVGEPDRAVSSIGAHQANLNLGPDREGSVFSPA